MQSTKLKKQVTLADVARVAGVSKTQASHALNGKGWVAPATREAIQRVARELGYEADPLAQRLSNGRCEKTIGFYTLDLDLSGRTRQMQLIQYELSDRGFSVPIYGYGYRGNNVTNQIALVKAMLAQRPRAVVCNTSGVCPEVFEYLMRFVNDGGIVACYGYGVIASVSCDQIILDEAHTTYSAAQHLLKKGHRDLGLFNVGQRVPAGPMREGFENALREWLFRNSGELRYEEEGELLAKQFLQLKKRPTAMIIANDYAATAFVSTLMRTGVRVPEDVSVVGDDNHPIAPHGLVPLTTVQYPVQPMAERVVEHLCSRIDGTYSGPARQEWLRGNLVERESTCVVKSLKRGAVKMPAEMTSALNGAGKTSTASR
jgi:LacI family transcriptional regulator